MNIQAIETQYKGYRFRSRLEARWAVFLDARGVEWEYEKEGYELSDGTRYLPDFWLPSIKVFIEIKGEEPTEEDKHKAIQLSDDLDYPVLIPVGPPYKITANYIMTHNKKIWVLAAIFLNWLTHMDKSALNKASSARFEFGEEG